MKKAPILIFAIVLITLTILTTRKPHSNTTKKSVKASVLQDINTQKPKDSTLFINH